MDSLAGAAAQALGGGCAAMRSLPSGCERGGVQCSLAVECMQETVPPIGAVVTFCKDVVAECSRARSTEGVHAVRTDQVRSHGGSSNAAW